MPARLGLTPDEMVERVRRQTNDRVKRHRERQRNVTRNVTGSTSGAPAPTYAGARSTAFLVTSSPTEKRENERTTDFEQVRCVLEPLRGYAHDERLLARLAARCPAVDLVLEAIGMAEWLNRPANRKRTCSKAFLSNWVKRAAAAPVGQPPSAPAERPRSALGRVLQQIATDPVAGPSTWH